MQNDVDIDWLRGRIAQLKDLMRSIADKQASDALATLIAEAEAWLAAIERRKDRG